MDLPQLLSQLEALVQGLRNLGEVRLTDDNLDEALADEADRIYESIVLSALEVTSTEPQPEAGPEELARLLK